MRISDCSSDGCSSDLELRTVLAALADHPVATLEVHPLPDRFDRSHGIPLDAASPLAQHLSQLIAQTAQGTPVKAAGSGEALYRMVVPAKVADQFATGIVRSTRSSAVPGGVPCPEARRDGHEGVSPCSSRWS